MREDPAQLIEQARSGDQHAVDLLLERYLPELRAFVRLRAGERIRARESASDIAQSVCRELLEHAERFQYRGEAGFKDWLYTTALRKIRSRYRYWAAEKRAAEHEAPPPSGSQVGSEASLLACYRSFCTPSQRVMHKEEVALVERAFDRLPDNYREVITLAHVVGLSRAEIGERMKLSEGAVRALLLRALAYLGGLVEREEEGKSGASR